MKKLIETIAQSAQTYPELDAFREALFGVMEIENEPQRVALGFGSSFIEISSDKVVFVCGSDRITVEELARIKSLADDLRQRLLLPFTTGTDEDVDLDAWLDGSPTMPEEIAGGWEPGTGGGAGIDDQLTGNATTWSSYKITLELGTKASSVHSHAINQITDLQTALDTKQNTIASSSLPVNPVENQIFIEPNAVAAQPWVYKSGNWYSDMMALDFPVPSFTSGSLSMSKLIPARIPRIWIDNIYAQLRSNGSGNPATDYYEMRLRVYQRTGTPIDLLLFNNQNQGIGSSRFNTTQPANQPIENAAYIEFFVNRQGTATTLNLTTSATIDLRYGR